MTFLVLATPRSLTAWLSNLLTDGSTVCYHDVLLDGGLERMQALAGVRVGFAETAGLAIPATLMRTFHDAPIVVVRSRPEQTAASLNRLRVDGDAFVKAVAPQIARGLSMLADRALFVAREDVLERATEIVEYLTGRRPDETRLALLRRLRITKVDPFCGDARALQELIRSER